MSAVFIKGNQRVEVPAAELMTRGRELLRNGWSVAPESSVEATAVHRGTSSVAGGPALDRVRLSGEALEGFLARGHLEGSNADLTFNDTGGTLVQQQVNREELERQVEDRSLVGGALRGAVGQLTFGLSDQALGFTDEVDQLQAQRQDISYMGGQLAGNVLPLLVGAPLSPAGLANVAGRTVARRCRVGALGILAEGAVEGAAAGFTDAMLSDATSADQIAERVLAGGGLGLALGGAFAGTGALARRGVRAGGAALTGGARAIAGRGGRAGGSLLDRAEMALTGSSRPASRFSERALIDHNNFQQRPGRFVREVTEPLSDMGAVTQRNVSRLADLDDAVARRMAEGVPDGQVASMRAGMARAAAEVAEIPRTLDTPDAAAFGRAARVIRGVGEIEDTAQMLKAAEKAASDLRRIQSGLGRGTAAHTRFDAVISGFDDILDGVDGTPFRRRRDLLREGEEIQSALARSFNIQPDDAFQPGQLQRALNEAAQTGDTNQLGLFDRLQRFNEEVAREFNPIDMQRARSMGEDMARIRSRLVEVGEVERARAFVARGDAWRGTANLMATGAAWAAGSALGLPFAMTGLLAAGAGGMALRLTSPVQTRARFAVLRQQLGRQATRATRAVAGIEANLASKSTIPKSFRSKATKLRPALGSVAHTLLREKPEQRREMYDRMMDEIERVSSDPATLGQRLNASGGELAAINPALPREVGMGMSQMLGVLMQEAARRNPRRAMANLMDIEIPPSQFEVDDFLRTAAVVEDPIFGLEMLEAGQMTPRAGRAMVRAFPQMMSQVVQRLLTTVAQRRSRGEGVNYQAMLQVSTALGAPMDNTMTPQFRAAMNNRSAQTAMEETSQHSQPISTRRPASITESTLTASQMLQR